MDHQTGAQHEEVPTIWTRVAPKASVSLSVVDQMRLSNKIGAAFRTRERFIFGVELLVHDQALLLCVLFAALRALVRLLARVESLVPQVIRFLDKLFTALRARIRLLARMDTPMENEAGFVFEKASTLGA